MMFNIGITGTRLDPTIQQVEVFEKQLKHIISIKSDCEISFRDGDCVGVDVTMGEIAKQYVTHSIIHPPIKDDLRAKRDTADIILEPKSYFARNRDIVDQSDILFVIPKNYDLDSKFGGTNYTYQYAVKKGKPVIVIFPDGSLRTW